MNLSRKYARMKWNDPIILKAVTSTHELVQCLHHAAVYELENVLLLIGYRAVRVIMVMWIQYDSLIKAAHLRFLDTDYNHGLKWAYEHIDNPPECLGQLVKSTVDASVDGIINEIKLNQQIIKSHNLPIPPYKYIIPKSTSK